MWLIAEYLPTSLFSLRMSNATNAVGKTLLIPSPYSLKMALLDASFRVDGVDATKLRFAWIKTLHIRTEPPRHAVVNGCFVKIQKLGDDGFGPAFALREYIAYAGKIRVAINVTDLSLTERDILGRLQLHINQMGKRGCFVQLAGVPMLQDGLYGSFTQELQSSFEPPDSGLLQPLDDMQPNATFDEVNAYSDPAVRATSRDRIRRSVPTVTPYVRRQTSKGFTHYERRDG